MTNHPPSVLWHCWLGHQTSKNRRPYNLYCVGADVKPCSINQSLTNVSYLTLIEQPTIPVTSCNFMCWCRWLLPASFCLLFYLWILSAPCLDAISPVSRAIRVVSTQFRVQFQRRNGKSWCDLSLTNMSYSAVVFAACSQLMILVAAIWPRLGSGVL